MRAKDVPDDGKIPLRGTKEPPGTGHRSPAARGQSPALVVTGEEALETCTSPAKILLAADGSAEAELASRAAVRLADTNGSELHLVHVGRLPNPLMKDPGSVGHDCVLYEDLEREARETLRRVIT